MIGWWNLLFFLSRKTLSDDYSIQRPVTRLPTTGDLNDHVCGKANGHSFHGGKGFAIHNEGGECIVDIEDTHEIIILITWVRNGCVNDNNTTFLTDRRAMTRRTDGGSISNKLQRKNLLILHLKVLMSIFGATSSVSFRSQSNQTNEIGKSRSNRIWWSPGKRRTASQNNWG